MTARRANILMVDDHAPNLLALEAALAGLDANLVRAESGVAALRCLLEQDFAAILLDVQMPGMDGFETAQRIRQRDQLKHTPIVFLTAIGRTDADVAKGYAVGAVDYIVKPVDAAILRARIEFILELYQEREEQKSLTAALAERADELARSNTELEQFVYVASHDLREPLRMVVSFLQLLEKRCGEQLDAESLEFLDFAVDGAKRMDALIDGLLLLYRTEKGATPEPTEANEALAAALQVLQLAIEESGAEVVSAPLPTVRADPAQLADLLQNLIGNSIKYTGSEAIHIQVGCDKVEEGWRFHIRDNGLGIAPEFHDRVFRIFQRLHTRAEHPGTGIGLAVCKKIVERHGGRIWVESEPGEGSTFFFTLPDSGC